MVDCIQKIPKFSIFQMSLKKMKQSLYISRELFTFCILAKVGQALSTCLQNLKITVILKHKPRSVPRW